MTLSSDQNQYPAGKRHLPQVGCVLEEKAKICIGTIEEHGKPIVEKLHYKSPWQTFF